MISYALLPPEVALVKRSYATAATAPLDVPVCDHDHEDGMLAMAESFLLRFVLRFTLVYDLTPVPPPDQLQVVAHLMTPSQIEVI